MNALQFLLRFQYGIIFLLCQIIYKRTIGEKLVATCFITSYFCVVLNFINDCGPSELIEF